MSDLPGATDGSAPDRPSAGETKHVELRLQDLDWRLDAKSSSRQAEDRHRALNKMLDDPERGYEIVLNFGETRFGQLKPDLLTPMLELVRRGAELPTPMRAQLIEHLQDPQIVHEIADAAVGLVRPEFAKYNNQHLVDQVLGQIDAVSFDDLSGREIFALEVPAPYTVFGIPTTRSVPFGLAVAVLASNDPFMVRAFREQGCSTLRIAPGAVVSPAEPLGFSDLDCSPLVRLSQAANRTSKKVATLYFAHMVPRTLEILEERQRRRPNATSTPKDDDA